MKRKMPCVIDGRHLAGDIAGVQRFTHEVLQELDKIAKPGEYEILVPPDTKNILGFQNIPVKKYGCFKGLLWEQTCLPWYLITRRRYGAFLCTIVPLLYPRGVAVVHDIMPKTVPEVRNSFRDPIVRALLLLNYRIAVKHADILATVSEYSKREIAEAYGKNPEGIHVIGNGWQHILRVKPEDSWKLRFPQLKDGEYFFSLSASRIQKNFNWVRQVAKRHPQYMFAIAGGRDEWQKQEEYGASNLIHLGRVSDGEMLSLMENCRAFLFPSLVQS